MPRKVSTIPRNWLVGEWLLDNNTLDTDDWTKNNGTPTNVTYENTDVGYQVKRGVFNGSNAYITATTWDYWDTFSYSFTYSTTSTSLVLLFDNGSAGIARNFIALNYDGPWTNVGKLWFFWATSGGSFWTSYADIGATLYDWKPHTVTVTRASGSGTPSIIFDWVVYSTTWTIPTGDITSGSIRIWSASDWTFFFNWKCQSFRIYSRVLSTSEIQSLYREWLRMLGGKSMGRLMDWLVGYWDFRWDSNEVVGGKNGTVSGASLATNRFGISNGAYSFASGTNNRIYASQSVYNANSPWTMLFIMKLNTGLTTGQRRFYGAPNSADGTALYHQIYFNNTTLYMNGSATALTYAWWAGDTNYHVWGFNYYGSTSDAIYLDGTSVASGVSTGGSAQNIYPVIGEYSGGSSGLNGIIDSVLIFNRNLSADEMKVVSQSLLREIVYPWN